MTLQTSGPISLEDIVAEFRPGYSGVSSIDEYYRNGAYVPSNISGITDVQTLFGSGNVSNTPNQGADRNQVYELSMGPDFSTSPLNVSESGSVNLPGSATLYSGVQLATFEISVSGSGSTATGAYQLTDSFGNVAATITVAAASQTPEVDYITSNDSSWTPRFTDRSFTVYAIGGGGSGGAANTDSGREKVSSGGGAGGTAVRTYPAGTVGSISIGAGGTGATAVYNSAGTVGKVGGDTTFNPNSGTTIVGGGGGRGGASGNDGGSWGYSLGATGGSGSGGTSNYTGGGTQSWNLGSDHSAATGGGSVNFGLGGDLEGVPVQGSGGPHFSASGGAPTLPTGITTTSTRTFRGGPGVQHSSGSAGSAIAGALYGAGGGSASSEGGTATSAAGAQGVVIIVYANPVSTATLTNISSEWVGRFTLSAPTATATEPLGSVSLFSGQSWSFSVNPLYRVDVSNTSGRTVVVNGDTITNFNSVSIDNYQSDGAYSWALTTTIPVDTLPTFSINLDTAGMGVFTNVVSGTFSANLNSTQALGEVRAAILAAYPTLTDTIGSVSNNTLLVDTEQTGNLNASFTCVANDGRDVMCSIDSAFVSGNVMIPGSSYGLFDYASREITSFTHNPGSGVPNNIAYVLGQFETAVDSNTETPVDYTAQVSNNNLVLTSTTQATVNGTWSVVVDHGNGTGNIAFGTSGTNTSGTAARTTVGRTAGTLNSTIPTSGAISFEDFYGTRRLTAEEQ